jgi:hypothetical protein
MALGVEDRHQNGDRLVSAAPLLQRIVLQQLRQGQRRKDPLHENASARGRSGVNRQLLDCRHRLGR